LATSLITIAAIAISIAFAFSRGQDVNFDQLNYHIYSAYAFLQNRIDIDVAPAQIAHSFFNPLALLPYYIPLEYSSARAASLVISTLQATVLAIIFLIALAVYPVGTSPQRLACAGGATVISAASPWSLSEIGTSFTDVTTGIPILIGVAILVRSSTPKRLMVCGILAGCAVALKLTNAPFAIGLAAASVISQRNVTSRATHLFSLTAGLAIGFVIVGGYWFFVLWNRFSNPIFPLYNNLFLSSDYPTISGIVDKYVPSSVFDSLTMPFRWATVLSEPGYYPDIRFAVAFSLMCILLTMAIVSRSARLPILTSNSASSRLLVFWVVSFCVWLFLISVRRYIVIVELLAGPVLLVLCSSLVRDRKLGTLTLGASMWGLAAASWATITIPDWGHTDFTRGGYDLKVPRLLKDDSIFFVAGEPISYIIPQFSKKAVFFGIIDWEPTAATAETTFTRRIEHALTHAGTRKIWVLTNSPLTAQTRITLGSYGLQLTGKCVNIPGYSLSGYTFACELTRGGENRPAAISIDPGSPLISQADMSFSVLSGFRSNAGLKEWHLLPRPIAVLRKDRRPGVYLHLSEKFGSGPKLLRVNYYPVTIDNGDVRRLEPAAPNGILNMSASVNEMTLQGLNEGDEKGRAFVACIPADAIGSDRIVSIEFHADQPTAPAIELLSVTLSDEPECSSRS
jgi:hypothetical protein